MLNTATLTHTQNPSRTTFTLEGRVKIVWDWNPETLSEFHRSQRDAIEKYSIKKVKDANTGTWPVKLYLKHIGG